MNERIKALVKQSHLDVYGLGKDQEKWDMVVEKFAELIVRECIKAYNDDGYQTEYEQDLKVLKHFGVEE